MALLLYALIIPSRDFGTLESQISILPEDIQRKILKNKFNKDRKRDFFSYRLLRHILKAELNKKEDELRIVVGKHGKPFLDDGNRHFNVSHSNDIIIVATDNYPIGVDVEYIHPIEEMPGILDLFSEEEKQSYFSRGATNKLDFFYRLWTLKESYIKAIGKGMSYPLNSFTIRFNNESPYLIDSNKKTIEWNFIEYLIQETYRCSICTKQIIHPKDFIFIESDDLCI